MNRKSLYFLVITYSVLVFSYYLFNVEEKLTVKPKLDVETFISIFDGQTKIQKAKYYVDIADNYFLKFQGLSEVASIPENHGLLMVYEIPGVIGIWMKEMLFSLDIIWLDENKKIIYIYEDFKPEDYPKVIYPPKDASYILEINSGQVKKNHLKVGDYFILNNY